MPLLLVKLVITPLLVGGSTLVARRFGPSVGGWLIALPLTSGPVLVFVALDHGLPFAADAATGALAGLAAIAFYCIGYALIARRLGPIPSLAVASAAFAVAGVALQPLLGASVWLVAAVVVGSILAATSLIPASRIAHPPVRYPAWDLPARMLVATALVVAITTFAPLLGARWSGLLATFPVYLSVLTAFTHRHAGPIPAADVLRGLLAGLYGTAAFYVVIHLALAPYGLAVALVAAIAAALSIEVAVLGRIRPAVEPEPA